MQKKVYFFLDIKKKSLPLHSGSHPPRSLTSLSILALAVRRKAFNYNTLHILYMEKTQNFASIMQGMNEANATRVAFIEKNNLKPSTDVAATANNESNVIACDRNSFGWFKAGRKYRLAGTALFFACEKQYKKVTSGGYTVFFGKITFGASTMEAIAFNSDNFTALRAKLGLPVPDKKTDTEGLLERVQKHIERICMELSKIGIEQKPDEVIALEARIKTDLENYAKVQEEREREREAAEAKRREEKEALRKEAMRSGVSVAVYAERKRAETAEKQLAEALALIAKMQKEQKPRAKK